MLLWDRAREGYYVFLGKGRRIVNDVVVGCARRLDSPKRARSFRSSQRQRDVGADQRRHEACPRQASLRRNALIYALAKN